MTRFLFVPLLLVGFLPITPLPLSAQEDPALAACHAFDAVACTAVLANDPGNLTAQFMRGLAADLAGDDATALADFDAVVAREPRHFGAQLWRHVVAATLGRSDDLAFRTYLDQAGLPPWPTGLGLHYLGALSDTELLSHAAAQPVGARAEALCAAHYHIGRAAELAGDVASAQAAFRAALATGASHVFEYRAAERALQVNP
jgi:lipoprotein NlpI